MKLITAVLKPGQFDEVVRAATDAGARGLTCSEVRGFGQQFGYPEPSAVPSGRGALVVPKLRVDIVVQDETAQSVVGAIAKVMDTGTIGGGKIWVSPVEAVMRARTGERDRDAV